METGGVQVLIVTDGTGPESEGAAEDIGPKSEEVAAEDVVDPLLSVDFDPLLATKDIGLDSLLSVDSLLYVDSDVLLTADGVVPDSQEVTPELLALAPDSMEVVPDSLPPGVFVCGRCGLVHEGREAWNHTHSRFYSCPSCGLVHADIAIGAMLGRIKVDYERFMEHCLGWLPTKEDAKASQE